MLKDARRTHRCPNTVRELQHSFLMNFGSIRSKLQAIGTWIRAVTLDMSGGALKIQLSTHFSFQQAAPQTGSSPSNVSNFCPSFDIELRSRDSVAVWCVLSFEAWQWVMWKKFQNFISRPDLATFANRSHDHYHCLSKWEWMGRYLSTDN